MKARLAQHLVMVLCVCAFGPLPACSGQTLPSAAPVLEQSNIYWINRSETPDQVKVRLIVTHLKHGDVASAANEIKTAPNRNDLIVEIVQQASEDSVALDALALFTTRTGFRATNILAMNALLEEMEEADQLHQVETLILHYGPKRFDQSGNSTRGLLERVWPYADAILESLVDDIQQGDFTQPLRSLDVTAQAQLSEDFLGDVVTRYLDKTEAPFSNLYGFFERLTDVQDSCLAFSVAQQHLDESGRGDGFEALQTWLYAKYNMEYSQYHQLPEKKWAKCKNVAELDAPAHKDILTREYVQDIRYRDFNQITTWHKQFGAGMKVLLSDVIKGTSRQRMQDKGFDTMADAVDRIADAGTICWAAEAIRQRLSGYDMLGTPEHFRALLKVKTTMGQLKFHRVDSFDAAKCDKAQKNAPAFFRKVLYGDISNCRLLSRIHKEPLYCASWWNENVDGTRAIYTWVAKEEHPDQFWNLVFTPEGFVQLQNNGRPQFFLARYTEFNYPYAAEQRSSFRLHARSDKYIWLENDGYLGIMPGDQEHYRDTQYYKNADRKDRKIQWKLECNYY